MNQQLNDDRIKHTYYFVKNFVEEDGKFQKEFRSLARSFPTMVHNNGLSAAIAFLLVKDKSHHRKLYETLEKWLSAKGLISLYKEGKSRDLLEAVINLSRDEYRMVSREVMVYMQWIKRFAEGMLSDGEQEEQSEKAAT